LLDDFDIDRNITKFILTNCNLECRKY